MSEAKPGDGGKNPSTPTSSRKSGDQKPARLPSLRGPRDLTLGGVRKKTFTPNIPTRKERVKQEPKDEASPATATKERSKRGGRQRGRGRGRGRGRQEIIQSHSIFEAGPSAEPTKKRSESAYGFGGGTTKDAIEKPTIKKEAFNEEYEKERSEEALKSLEGDVSFVADLENDESLLPMTLPMSQSTWPPGKNVKNEVKVKSEVKSKKRHIKSEASFDCADLFLSDDEYEGKGRNPTDLILFQLPDTLPAVAPSSEGAIKIEADHGPVKIKQEPGTEAKTQAEEKYCTLDQLSEGYVGKLQVLKSGRCRLVLGHIRLEMSKGTPTSFHEEIASVRLPPEGDESSQGHLTVLGEVAHKIVCMPDMERLITHAK